MYAAILAENEVNFADIKNALNKRGWAVFGKGIEQLEEAPSNVVVWILYAWKTLGYPDMPIRGYVRIGSEWSPIGKTYFYVIESGLVAFVYYHVLSFVLYKWEKMKRALKARTDLIGLTSKNR
jgi:hypothetical protein